MRISYDPAKNELNIRKRGLPFDRVAGFDFDTALVLVDDRHDYGETRYVAVGMLEDRVHVLCFAETADGVCVISFRKANAREVKRYVNAQAHDRQRR